MWHWMCIQFIDSWAFAAYRMRNDVRPGESKATTKLYLLVCVHIVLLWRISPLHNTPFGRWFPPPSNRAKPCSFAYTTTPPGRPVRPHYTTSSAVRFLRENAHTHLAGSRHNQAINPITTINISSLFKSRRLWSQPSPQHSEAGGVLRGSGDRAVSLPRRYQHNPPVSVSPASHHFVRERRISFVCACGWSSGCTLLPLPHGTVRQTARERTA